MPADDVNKIRTRDIYAICKKRLRGVMLCVSLGARVNIEFHGKAARVSCLEDDRTWCRVRRGGFKIHCTFLANGEKA